MTPSAAVCCDADGLIFTNSTWKTMGLFRVEIDIILGQVHQHFLNGPGRMPSALQTTAAMKAPLRACVQILCQALVIRREFDDATREAPKDATATGRI